jgi:hypothetical protein
MIDLATIWPEIVELPPSVTKLMVPTRSKGKKVAFANYTMVLDMTFDKSSAHIRNLVYYLAQ